VKPLKQSHPYDPELHEAGSPAADGKCSYHGDRRPDTGDLAGTEDLGECSGGAVVSYQDDDGGWQSGCSNALEQLVEREEIEPLGQGA
jgi:hypothetical protein